jgi:hypothetical protein
MEASGGDACDAIAKVHAEVDSFGGNMMAAVDSYSEVVARYSQTADLKQHMYSVCTAASVRMKLYDVPDQDLTTFRFLLGMHALLAVERMWFSHRFGADHPMYPLSAEVAAAHGVLHMDQTSGMLEWLGTTGFAVKKKTVAVGSAVVSAVCTAGRAAGHVASALVEHSREQAHMNRLISPRPMGGLSGLMWQPGEV